MLLGMFVLFSKKDVMLSNNKNNINNNINNDNYNNSNNNANI